MPFYLLQYRSVYDAPAPDERIILLSLFLKLLVGVFMVLAFIGLIRMLFKRSNIPNAHWHHLFEKPEFSPQEFYAQLGKFLGERHIPQSAISKVVYSEGGLLSKNRDYIRITYKQSVFDICAAPFGAGFFVSWWLGDIVWSWNSFWRSIPIIGFFVRGRNKTFFELDTEIAFKDTVSRCVRQAIEALSAEKGFRMLSEQELQSYNRRLS